MSAPVSSDPCALSEVARHIARAAARLFASRGYEATAVREIVAAAGVTKPTLYYHFKSKEGLAQALVTNPLAELLRRLEAAREAGGEPVDVLVRAFEIHFAFAKEDPDRSRFLYAIFFGPNAATLAAELADFGDRLDGVMFDVARPLAAAGLIAGDRVDDFAAACRGMIVVSTLQFLYRGGELEPGLARRLVSDLLYGFGRFEGRADDQEGRE